MPAIHTVSFPVRYYECDAYGHVNHANYPRYMVEAAFGASQAVGYDGARLAEMGHIWFPREHEIEYLRPLTYGDTVTVKTWVADFRRVRSVRLYELTNQRGEMVAKASTDWVYVNVETQYPATVPTEMIAAFHPEGAPPIAPKREKFPTPPPYAPQVFKSCYMVEWRDVDPQKHVNNAAYLSYIENCAMDMMRAYGWTSQQMETAGFAIVARRYRIEYLRPAVLDDQIEVATWVSDKKRATAVRHYEIRRASTAELLVRARALWVWVNIKTGMPIRIPADFLADFQPNFTDQ